MPVRLSPPTRFVLPSGARGMADAGLGCDIPPATATNIAADREAKGVANRLRLLQSLACVDVLGFASCESTGPMLPEVFVRLVREWLVHCSLRGLQACRCSLVVLNCRKSLARDLWLCMIRLEQSIFGWCTKIS